MEASHAQYAYHLMLVNSCLQRSDAMNIIFQHRNEYNISYILQNNKDLNNSDGILSFQEMQKLKALNMKVESIVSIATFIFLYK